MRPISIDPTTLPLSQAPIIAPGQQAGPAASSSPKNQNLSIEASLPPRGAPVVNRAGGLAAPASQSLAEVRPQTLNSATSLDKACAELTERLHVMESNEVLRNELQAHFVRAIKESDKHPASALKNCFDSAFAVFAQARPQFHWKILAEVFMPAYVEEARLVLAEYGI